MSYGTVSLFISLAQFVAFEHFILRKQDFLVSHSRSFGNKSIQKSIQWDRAVDREAV